MAELGDFLVSEDSTANIDVEMLDYGFIGKCNDPKILRGIVDTLQSGKEGLYPELCQAAEDKLLSLLPEKERRRIMRLKHQTTPDQVNEAQRDLDNWQSDVRRVDSELRSIDSAHTTKKLPPVRGQKVEKLGIPVQHKTIVSKEEPSEKLSTPRLSGYDFPAWEKFDVEEALASLDNDEDIEGKDGHAQRLKKKRVKKRMERHANTLHTLRTEMNISEMSSVQRKTRAAREKQKGNESFKAGENDEAYEYYTRSLALDDSIATVYSNRAAVCLRTGKLETAEDDCSRALFLDSDFTKARSRRGIARFKSGKYELAIQDFEIALEKERHNKELESLLQKAMEKYSEVEGKEYISKQERERREAAMKLAIVNGLPIKVVDVSTSEALLVQVTGDAVEFVDSGTCEIVENVAEKLTRIAIEEDSDSDSDEDEDRLEENGLGGLTRIKINEDSESEDETDDSNIEDTKNDEDASEVNDGFIRIAIADDSDSESDSEGNKDVPIIDDVAEKSDSLKTQANVAMQEGNFTKAVQLYTDCISFDPSSVTATAAYGNRSLAYLKLKQYANVLDDTSTVISRDADNLKALYRRALAYEAIAESERAVHDLDSILRIQPRNDFALQARERIQRAYESTSIAATSSNVEAPQISMVAKAEIKPLVDPCQVERSVQLKNLGNDAMKGGNIDAAIEYYSQAIECDKSNVLFFNNRAQAYIKSSQFLLAETDASHVIEHDKDSNVKAYFRRALARKGLNTIESLRSAQDDLKFILSSEPGNKAASTEKQKIDNMLITHIENAKKEKDRIVQEFASTKDAKIGKNSIGGLTERSSKVKVRSDEAVVSSKEESVQKSSLNQKEQKSSSSTTSKTKAAKDISVKNPHVPDTPPKTVYEFERIWRGLKNRPDLFATYLKNFKKSTYKKVVKETCSPDLLSSMLVSVRDHLLTPEGNVDKGVSVLEGLSSIQKYDMVHSLLPSIDLECMNSCLDYISVHLGQDKASSLREKLLL